jgi:amylosucrase
MARLGLDADVDLARIRAASPADAAPPDAEFDRRLAARFPTLHGLFRRLYGERDDALDQLAGVIGDAATSWARRPTDLRVADARREEDSSWYLSNRMLGGVCYVDRYAGDLAGVRARIPEFVELGLTYLHLMPLFAVPEGNSDGGYAVSSYRAVAPHLGTIDDLQELAAELRANGISLVLDFIFNHTASNHEWARRAVAGEAGYEDFYLIFPDRTMPDAYEKTVREIFPDDHPGSFVQLPDGRWIWATFHTFQWDLNYANPMVFRAMAGEMLFLANLGVDVLRMDAVAFIWKRLGTPCESLPEAHLLLQAFNAVLRIAAPSLLFKSEAIVHPDEVAEYISLGECQLSYNPLQMALTWEMLATRDPRMLRQALERRHALPDGCAWVNYVRGHDDIGWTFADEDAAEFGIQGYDHRRFLNAFYVNRFPGSFARGVPFQENPRTGDARVAGTTASLAGIEAGDPHGVDRVLLAHAIALSTGGIPLVYLGDEVAQLNDDSYLDDPALADDSRWVNRPPYPAAAYAQRHDRSTPSGAVYAGLRRLIHVRRDTPELAGGHLVPFDAKHPTVLAYQRPGAPDAAASAGTTILCLANPGDAPATIVASTLSGFAPDAHELLTDRQVSLERGIVLEPCHVAWLRVRPAEQPPRF